MIATPPDAERIELRRSNALAWWVAALMAVAALVALLFLVRQDYGAQNALQTTPDRVAAEQTLVSATSQAQSAADRATLAAKHAAENSARATEAAAQTAAAGSAQTAQATAMELQNASTTQGAPAQ